jgi:hypothetical protein
MDHQNQYDFFADEDLVMYVPNENNRNEIPKADIETINKAKLLKEDKLLNESYPNQLESNNHYVLGYN